MMKYSMYNTLVSLTDKYSLLYNSYSNIYLVLSSTLRNAIENFTLEIINKLYPVLYCQLVEAGCIINDSENEIELVEKRIRTVDQNDDTFWLTINPTINCNFRCWYCYEKHISKSKMNNNVLNNTLLFMDKTASQQNLKTFNLNFFGGEPLLYYHDVVLPIMEHYNRLLKRNSLEGFIGFTTNGYLIDDKMIVSFKENRVDSFQITLDGFGKEHDKTRHLYGGKGSFDKIVENIIKLLQCGFHVILRLNYTRNNVADMQRIVPLFDSLSVEEKQKLSVNFQQVWQDKDSAEGEIRKHNEVDSCMALFDDAGIHTSHNVHDYIWNSCYADKKNQLVINYNGYIYKCTARDFNDVNKVGILSDGGTVDWEREKIDRWSNIRFTNPECRKCRIGAICAGGCTQRHIELSGQNVCQFGYSDREKDNVVLNHFYNHIILNS